uniref:Uncharacterized protein n=1 Tax=Eucampia antarctica TaxID=49252 RepID=A0A7S2R0U9_9STRA|mmetsp:Transcript_1189/g.1105  ORF Transcript_1189/g.1105 Transcript_1189/m.1105 type:complete len:152 (+) Transcript_1189:450-905(+)
MSSLAVAVTEIYFPRNFVPIPPFLINIIETTINNYDGDGSRVLLSVIQAIIDYNDLVDSDDDENTKDGARASCIDIVYWLFLLTNKKIYSITTLGCSNQVDGDSYEVYRIYDKIDQESASSISKHDSVCVVPGHSGAIRNQRRSGAILLEY